MNKDDLAMKLAEKAVSTLSSRKPAAAAVAFASMANLNTATMLSHFTHWQQHGCQITQDAKTSRQLHTIYTRIVGQFAIIAVGFSVSFARL